MGGSFFLEMNFLSKSVLPVVQQFFHLLGFNRLLQNNFAGAEIAGLRPRPVAFSQT